MIRDVLPAHTIDPLLARVEKPSRYVGGELNAIKKDPATIPLLWAFAFPDAYDIGMSNLGMQILYDVLNRQPDYACERVFAPWPDMEAAMRSRGVPLFTLENYLPVQQADIFAFTIPYEIILSNVVNLILLAGLPLYARDRHHSDSPYPLVLGGGAIAMNPEPIADFFDAFVIGEGEEVVLEISQRVLEWKQAGSSDREALLESLAALEGVYVPSFFDPEYAADGRLKAFRPKKLHYKRTLRRIVADLDATPFPTAPVVPSLKTIHDRLAVEITRGCTAGCRFCQAGMITRPTRERSPETILRIVDASLQNTGYDNISLNSLSSGDYSCINSLLKLVGDRYNHQMISTSIPSLRVKTLTPEVAQAVATVRKSGFTIAPEAGSQRMRNAINKDVTDAELVRTVETIFQNGGQSVKMYFMCGLPGETDEDLDGIVHLGALAYQTARKFHPRPGIVVNVSTFVPKVFTPYQWAPQISREETLRRQRYLREKLRSYRQITLRTHYDYGTLLEGIFSRGDRRLSRLLEVAWRRGCRFDGWKEHLKSEEWEAAFVEAEIDPAWYLRERQLDEVLPWDHIEARVSKKFLKNEWYRHVQALYIPDCRWGDCAPCGSCHKEVKITTYDGQDPRQTLLTLQPGEGRTYRHPSVHIPPAGQSLSGELPGVVAVPPQKIRLRFSKRGPARFLGHLELTQAFLRAFRRLGINLHYSTGFHPRPGINFSNPIPIGMESRVEFVDLEVAEFPVDYDPQKLVAFLNDRQLPEGIVIEELATPSWPLQTQQAVSYRLELPADTAWNALSEELERLISSGRVLFSKTRHGTETQLLDIRPLILWLERYESELWLELATPISGTIKPAEVLSILCPAVDPADVRMERCGINFAGDIRVGEWRSHSKATMYTLPTSEPPESKYGVETRISAREMPSLMLV